MACHFENWPGIGPVIWCGPKPRKRRCAFCGCPDAKALCDYPTGDGKQTCDKPCCSNCRVHVGPNRDYCRDHWDMQAREAQGRLFA